MLGGLAGFLHLTGDLRPLMQEEGGEATLSIGAYVGFAVFGLLSYLVSFFFGGMTVHLVDVYLQGRDAKLGDAFLDALQNLPAIVILSLLSVLVDIIESMIRSAAQSARRSGGLGGLLLGGAGEMVAAGANWIWKVVVCLMLPIVILEDVGIGTAIQRGKDMHRQDLIGIGIGELGVELVTKGMVWVVAILGGILIFGATQAAPALLWLAIGVTALLVGAAWSIGTFVRWSYYTMLYLYAMDRSRNAANATMPTPLANATGYQPAYARGLAGTPTHYQQGPPGPPPPPTY
jgi:hypothetical protein